MSTETLSGLRDYLFSTLSRSNMLWLATQLKERAEKEEELKPYTIEELHQMVEEGRKQIAEGHYLTNEEVFSDLFEEFGVDEREVEEKELQLEEVV
jgi:hypothetical protein